MTPNLSHRYSGEGAVGEQRFALPWPPSVNQLYLNVAKRGRAKTARYKAWLTEAGLLLNTQRPTKLKVPVTVTVELHSPFGRGYDPDNRNKAVLDLLVAHGVIPDDSDRWVRGVNAVPLDVGAPCTVIVRPAW